MSTFSLADLEAYDPRSPQREGERRFLCPLCGDGKPQDAAHRSLTANMQSGAWNCKRCSAAGKLREFWQQPPAKKRRAHVRGSLRRVVESSSVVEPTSTKWREQLKNLVPVQGTAGMEYLQQRGVASEVAHAAGVRFSADFYGRPAVVFPIRNRVSTLVAATGRYVDGRDDPRSRTAGPKRDGVFFAPSSVNGRTFNALDKTTPAIIICEAPIDALSVAAAGFPAIALCGTSGPEWLHLVCGFRRVLLAFDGDEAGDHAATILSSTLSSFGARCERLRPDGAKDWNEFLQLHGLKALSEFLAVPILME